MQDRNDASSEAEKKECRNEKCLHRKQVTSKQALARKYAAIEFIQCPKCIQSKDDVKAKDHFKFIYCSMLCLRQDWNLRHCRECSGSR